MGLQGSRGGEGVGGNQADERASTDAGRAVVTHIIRCNRCLKEHQTRFRNIVVAAIMVNPGVGGAFTYDLCRRCIAALRKFLKPVAPRKKAR